MCELTIVVCTDWNNEKDLRTVYLYSNVEFQH